MSYRLRLDNPSHWMEAIWLTVVRLKAVCGKVRLVKAKVASVALVVAALVPQIGFYALFVMVLTGVVQRLLRRPLRRVSTGSRGSRISR